MVDTLGDMPAIGLSHNPVVQPEFGLGTAQALVNLEWSLGTGALYGAFCQK